MKAIKKTVRFAKSGFFGKDGDIYYLPNDVLVTRASEAIGLPVYLEHNAENGVYGYVTNVYKDPNSDWYNADIIVTDENMQSALEQEDCSGYKLSNGYKAIGEKGEFRKDGINYQSEINDLEWRELTLTKNPRYQDAVILNSDSEDTMRVFNGEFIGNAEKQEDNNTTGEEVMTNIKIDGVEYKADYVLECINNFEDGKKSFLSKLSGLFNTEVENKEEVEEKVLDEQEPIAEEAPKAEEESKEEVSKAEEEVTNEEPEEVKEEVTEEEAKEEVKEEITKTAEEVKNSLTEATKELSTFEFKKKTY